MVGLAANASARAQGPDGFPRSVQDAAGHTVTVLKPPQRIAVVGDDPLPGLLVPPARRAVLQPGDTPPATVDLLVLPTLYATAYSLENVEVPVFQTQLPVSLAEWRTAVETLATITGRERRGAAILSHLDRQLAQANALIAQQQPVDVLVLTPEGYTFGQDTLLHDLLTAAGGNNCAADYADFRQIDDAALHALDPTVILLTASWPGTEIFTTNPAYADLQAVQHERVYQLDFRATYPRDPGAVVLTLVRLLHLS